MKRVLLLVFTASILFACKDKKADKEKTILTKDDYSKTSTTTENKQKAGDEMENKQSKTDNGETSAKVSNWPQSEKNGFMRSCENKAMEGGASRELASSYCECMMGKMERAYPDIYEAAKLNQSQVDAFTNKNRKDCLEEH